MLHIKRMALYIIIGMVLINMAVSLTPGMEYLIEQGIISLNETNLIDLSKSVESKPQPEPVVVWKDNNMTVEFKEDNVKIGQAILKSHKTYDEIRRVTSGKNRTVIWYEFSDFKDDYLSALKGVEFIDMREKIENKSYTEKFNGDFDLMDESKILMNNPNYLLLVEKNYSFVYKSGDKWLPYNSFSIPKENIIVGVQTDLFWGEFIDVVFNVFDNKLDRHALVLGSNCGFVTEAPTVDPEGSARTIDGQSFATRDTSPTSAEKITEIGWYAGYAGEESNFEIGLYTDDAIDNEPEARLYVDTTNAVGTGAGWRTETVDWEIDSSTIYWIAVQVDPVGSPIQSDYASSGGSGYAYAHTQTELSNPWNPSYLTDTDAMLAVYAVWEAEAPARPLLNETFEDNNASRWTQSGTGTLVINSTAPITGSYSGWYTQGSNANYVYRNLTSVQSSNITVNFQINQTSAKPTFFISDGSTHTNSNSHYIICNSGQWAYYDGSAYQNIGLACSVGNIYNFSITVHTFGADSKADYSINGVGYANISESRGTVDDVGSFSISAYTAGTQDMFDNICVCPGTRNTTCCGFGEAAPPPSPDTINLSTPVPADLAVQWTPLTNVFFNVTGNFTYNTTNCTFIYNSSVEATKVNVSDGTDVLLDFNISEPSGNGGWQWFISCNDNTTTENTSTYNWTYFTPPWLNETFEDGDLSKWVSGGGHYLVINTTNPMYGTNSVWSLPNGSSSWYSWYRLLAPITDAVTVNVTVSFSTQEYSGDQWMVMGDGRTPNFGLNVFRPQCIWTAGEDAWAAWNGSAENMTDPGTPCHQGTNASWNITTVLTHNGTSMLASYAVNGTMGSPGRHPYGTLGTPLGTVSNLSFIGFGSNNDGNSDMFDNICVCPGTWNTSCCGFGEAPSGDDCSCPGAGTDKVFNLSLHCNITSPCTLDVMSFKDDGYFSINTTFNVSEFNASDLDGSDTIFIRNEGVLIIR